MSGYELLGHTVHLDAFTGMGMCSFLSRAENTLQSKNELSL